MTVAQEYTERMQDAFGWRPSKSVACPMVVAGYQCRRFRARGCMPCLCESAAARALLDHERMWLADPPMPRNCERALLRRVLTTEPYHVEPADLAEFRAELAACHISVEVHPVNYWFEGTTLLICRYVPQWLRSEGW